MNPKSEPPAPKAPSSPLHSMNLIVAMLAGIISITGGVYSLKNNFFAGPAYGSLQGIVRDGKIAKPLLLASVEVSGVDGAVVNTVETDQDGYYRVEKLKTGNYVVKFTAPLHKVESKTIRVEKDLASSINVDLVPEAQLMQTASLESPAVQTLTSAYAPVTHYPAATPAASSYNVAGTMSSATTVPPTYAPSNVPSALPQEPSDYQQPYSGASRRHPRRYPGDYDQTPSTNTATNSQGAALATAGAQLLQAWMSKKSDDSTTTTTN